MAQQLKNLIDQKVQFIANVFNELDVYFTQFDNQCQFIEDLLFSFFQFDKNDTKNDEYKNTIQVTQQNQQLQHSVSFTANNIKQEVHKSHSQSFVDIKDIKKQNQLQKNLKKSQVEFNKLRELFYSLINKLDKSETNEKLVQKNENLKKKKKILNEKIENLKNENSFLKIEVAINKEQDISQIQKSQISLLNDNMIETEQYKNLKEQKEELEKENYFLKLQVETTQTELIQAHKNIQQLQKYLNTQQEEFINLLKTPQKLQNTHQDDLFKIPEDQIPEKPTTFDEISNIQHVRQKSDVDPGLIDKLINQNQELIASFNQNAREALLEEEAFRPMNFKMQRTIQRNTTLDLDYKEEFKDFEKDQLQEMFFESELMLLNGKNKLSRIHSQNDKSLSQYNSLKKKYQSSYHLVKNKIDNNIKNNLSKKQIQKNKSSIEFTKDFKDQNVLQGFNDLGSFRAPVNQNDNSKIVRKSLSTKNDKIRKIDSEILKLEKEQFQVNEEENEFLKYHFQQILQQEQFENESHSFIEYIEND